METLQIEKQNALKAYSEAGDKSKRMLENLFGKKVFQLKVTDRIKTFEDAMAEVTVSDEVKRLLAYTGSDPSMIAAVSFTKATIICQSLNEGWVPNWDNSSEYKYYPWFLLSSSGGGFRYGDFGYRLFGFDCRLPPCFQIRRSGQICRYPISGYLQRIHGLIYHKFNFKRWNTQK